jgi:hypothetical protein
VLKRRSELLFSEKPRSRAGVFYAPVAVDLHKRQKFESVPPNIPDGISTSLENVLLLPCCRANGQFS